MGAPPPVPPAGAGPIAFLPLLQDALNVIVDSPLIHNIARLGAGEWAYRWAAATEEFNLDIKAAALKKALAQQAKIEAHAGPLLLEFAVAGLKDFLGVDIPAGQLGAHGGHAGRTAAASTIGQAVMGAMFGAFNSTGAITPASGRANAEKLITAVVETGLEGWLGSNLSLGYITKDLPNWGDLDDIMARNLGMGRVTSRVLRPIIDALIVQPFQQHLHSQLLDALPTVSEAVRLLNRGHIGEPEFFPLMARHGYGTVMAGQLRVLNSQQLSRSDLQRLFDLGFLSGPEVATHLKAQGYTPALAEAIVTLIKNDRISSIDSALATLARDMYRDRDIDRPTAEAMLDTIGYTNEEKTELLAVAQIERSRPKRVSEADLEKAFRLELIDGAELARRYELAGYAPFDVELLVTMAVHDKQVADDKAAAKATPRPKLLTESEWMDLHRRGLIDTTRLSAALLSLHYLPEQLPLLVAQAEARRAEFARAEAARAAAARGVRPTRATIEEAYLRGMVDDATLQARYAASGIAGEDLALLMRLRIAERAEYQAKLAAAAAGAAGSGSATRA